MLTIQSDSGKQDYKVCGKKYCRPKVVPFPAVLAADMAATGFGDARNPELAAWPDVSDHGLPPTPSRNTFQCHCCGRNHQPAAVKL